MSFVDKSLKCSDCGADFTFTSSEQDFFAEKAIPTIPRLPTMPRYQKSPD